MPAPRPAGGGLASEIADPGLAASGAARIGERFAVSQPLRGLTIAACLHVTAETAVLAGVAPHLAKPHLNRAGPDGRAIPDQPKPSGST